MQLFLIYEYSQGLRLFPAPELLPVTSTVAGDSGPGCPPVGRVDTGSSPSQVCRSVRSGGVCWARSGSVICRWARSGSVICSSIVVSGWRCRRLRRSLPRGVWMM
ncbi:hypothetical protein ACOMHN_008765 [Nucella lapillus]